MPLLGAGVLGAASRVYPVGCARSCGASTDGGTAVSSANGPGRVSSHADREKLLRTAIDGYLGADPALDALLAELRGKEATLKVVTEHRDALLAENQRLEAELERRNAFLRSEATDLRVIAGSPEYLRPRALIARAIDCEALAGDAE